MTFRGKACFGLSLLLALPSGCTVGPDFVRPGAPRVRSYARGGDPKATLKASGLVQRFDAGAKVPAEWWKLFRDPQLDALIEAALDSSPSLQAALATLRQSQQNLEAGFGVLYPQLDANAGYSRQKSNPSSFGVDVPSSEFNLFTASANVSYALDLFGAERRTLEGLKAQVGEQRYAVLAAYLSLTGNIANTVIARAAYQAQIEATREIIGIEKEQVAITSAQVRSGTTADAALLSIRSQLAATEATLPSLEQKLTQSGDLLASLAGKEPSAWRIPPIRLADLSLPESLPVSLPSELARQRPDILQSEALLHVASAQVGVATAALYPSFAVTGEYGVLNTSAGNLFNAGSSLWDIGGNILAPIFHGGTLRARKRAAIEAFRAALFNYRQTVIDALSQTADALRGLEHDAESLRAQSEGVKSSSGALELIKASFRAGTATYLQLLSADSQYAQARIGYFQAQGQRLQDTVALFLALGGGWWNGSPFERRIHPQPRNSPNPVSAR